MRPYVYNENMSIEEQKNGAYWERNMLALYTANQLNRQAIMQHYDKHGMNFDGLLLPCGYYVHGEWKGWSRVITLDHGKITFHVPDDFDLGGLPQVKSNWDGHTTEEKWQYVAKKCGVSLS